jgi:hypothetical protein
VYRRSRALWPLSPLAPPMRTGSAGACGAASHVTIRIDQMKDQTLADIQNVHAFGDAWVLKKCNELEGVVERFPLNNLQELLASSTPASVLKFWRCATMDEPRRP